MATTTTPTAKRNRRPLISAGMLLGVGLGGFVDGIVFHQLLQVHSMLSARRPRTSVVNLEVNMFWDGVFHAFTWLMTAAGVAMLFRAGRRADVPWSGRTLLGAMLAGWGTFNLVEGVIDHHVLHVHHVVESLGGVSAWDWAFLASGVVLIATGVAMIRGARRDTGTASEATNT
jgi:uncharacterized membrane protein